LPMNSEPQLDSLLKQMAEGHRPELPSPDLIWWRAQILKKQDQKRRIERPLMVIRQVAIVVCLAFCLALLAANWQMVASMSWMLLPLAIAAAAAFLTATIELLRSPASNHRGR
jgi:hypothetical protein